MKCMEKVYATSTFFNFESQEDKTIHCSRIYRHKPLCMYIASWHDFLGDKQENN